MESTELWEVLVPTVSRVTGRPLRTRFHRVWDSKVMAISGGMTILRPAQGRWISPDGQLFHDRMIPVRIACTREQIEEVIQLTLKHYDELTVMAVRVSECVLFRDHPNPTPVSVTAVQP